MPQRYLSELIGEDEILSSKPGRFNIIKANPGAGKTTFLLQEKFLKLFARSNKHVLYLINNINTRDFIANRHKDIAVVYADHPLDGWFAHRDQAGTWGKQDDNHVHVMCYQTFAALIRNKGIKWLDDIDLILWDEFDDIRGFYKNEIKGLKKILKNANTEQLHNLMSEYKNDSLAAFVTAIKDTVLEPGRIVLIAVSATPEIAAVLFQDYVNQITFGGEQIKYEAKLTTWYRDLMEAFNDGTIHPEEGRIYWCFVPYIWHEQVVSRRSSQVNFNPLVLWSANNAEHRDEWTVEQQIWTDCLKKGLPLPHDGHDFIIVNGAFARGIDVTDPRITDWIFAGDSYEDMVQFMRARFDPPRQYLPLKMKGMIQFIQNGIPAVYYDWHTLAELKELLVEQPIFKDWKTEELKDEKWEGKPFETWQAVKKYYEDKIEYRRFGRSKIVQYRFKPNQT